MSSTTASLPFVRLPGAVVRYLDEIHFASPHDSYPDAWHEAAEALSAAPRVRRGFGFYSPVVFTADQAHQVIISLDLYAGALESMTCEERGSDDPRPFRTAIRRLEAAIRHGRGDLEEISS